jgi:hypothetical protein
MERSECESDQPQRYGHLCYGFVVQCRYGGRIRRNRVAGQQDDRNDRGNALDGADRQVTQRDESIRPELHQLGGDPSHKIRRYFRGKMRPKEIGRSGLEPPHRLTPPGPKVRIPLPPAANRANYDRVPAADQRGRKLPMPAKTGSGTGLMKGSI